MRALTAPSALTRSLYFPMKLPRPLPFLAAALLCAPFAVTPAARADLLITQKVEGVAGMAGMETTTRVKGDKLRVDATPEMSMLVDVKTGDMINLMHAQKSYLKISGEMAKTMMAQMKPAAGAAAPAKPDLKPTGKKETINGYASEEYTTTVNGMKLDFMLTKALPNYESALKQLADAAKNGPMAQQAQGMGLDFGTLPGFPLRTSMEMAGQKMVSTVTNLSTATLPESEFALPAGYKELTMPTMTPPAPAPAR